MRLFHGSTVTVKRPNIQKGRKATDFGKGFYTTTNFEQAKKWALLKKIFKNMFMNYLVVKKPDFVLPSFY